MKPKLTVNRINNIEWRKYYDKKHKYLYEIIKWYPNVINISNSYFISPEHYYVLAWIKKDKEGYYLESVGSRPIELTDHELQDFITVWKQADKKLNKKQK